ncbi:uncharacterized protein LOC132192950 isoform X2 [Neocloeon triangulifer]|uniref:uncharacterized protein LOC132192950 isoform X2 n=1 Tax=Neocloeon triangulifer TaxID=2078957 RepID=UPI00286EEFA4|nr:uncharacterized protein LOC132192950 isoform X2 [Neocloeon triangulifer]
MGTRVQSAIHSDKTLSGVSGLLEDLRRLLEDKDSADIVFLLGREESPVYAHRLILAARCTAFQGIKRGEICRIPGTTVTAGTAGAPATVRLPHYSEANFRTFLIYVYTGKLVLQDSGVFEMMGLAHELGLEELRVSCEDHVTSTLAVANACTFLAAALDMHERSAPHGGRGAKNFLDTCISFIAENAIECFKTNSFLSLSKEALIKVISSDFLAVEEEEVWRAVLAWAKNQAGVTQPTAHWAEEERARVCQHLAGVINHVRLLLIDSQVFAEEVEPTGAVPIELSLERYRFAALPNKFREQSEDKRYQPRMSCSLFPGSQILSLTGSNSFGDDKLSYQRILNEWYGNPKQQWRLVFRASAHNFSAQAFHRICDGISPTYTIVASKQGHICGGFSNVPWERPQSKGYFAYSDKAFLFTLANNQDIPPTKFPVVKRMFAVVYVPNCGPVFGAGADLSISNNCNRNTESYSNLPHTYDGEGATMNTLMGGYNFQVQDYEVFTTSSN